MENPTDRKIQRKFRQFFNGIDHEALKLHIRIKASPNAKHYNTICTGKNCIQKAEGTADNHPLILKVRINGSYRKFFNYICDIERGDLLLTKDWAGEFEAITDIHVIDINKHDYSGIN